MSDEPGRGYTEPQGYAASLRQMAQWVVDGKSSDVDECELCAAAGFIERQQAEIERLREENHKLHIELTSLLTSQLHDWREKSK